MTRSRPLLILVGLAALITLFLIKPPESAAYSVTVKNTTDSKVKVCLFINKLYAVPKFGESVYLDPGQSHTWETGAWCPASLQGIIKSSKGWKKFPMVDCQGTVTTSAGSCCWNLTFFVCRQNGTGDTIEDNDFKLCK